MKRKKLSSEQIIYDKKNEVKNTLSQIGLSRPKFASRYLIDTNENDLDENEVKRGIERILQHLKRGVRNSELYDTYLRYIKKQPEYLASGLPFIKDKGNKQRQYTALSVARAYASSLGEAWDFKMCRLENNELVGACYLVIWDGDIGCNGGSGSWGTSMCEINQSRWGDYYVGHTQHYLKMGLRSIKDIVSYRNGILSVRGCKYDKHDANNFPSLLFEVRMVRADTGWVVIGEKFIKNIRD